MNSVFIKFPHEETRSRSGPRLSAITYRDSFTEWNCNGLERGVAAHRQQVLRDAARVVVDAGRVVVVAPLRTVAVSVFDGVEAATLYDVEDGLEVLNAALHRVVGDYDAALGDLLTHRVEGLGVAVLVAVDQHHV